VLQALASDHDTGKLKARASDFSLEKAADAYLRAVFGTNAPYTLRHVKP
jgi:hypothetical protein